MDASQRNHYVVSDEDMEFGVEHITNASSPEAAAQRYYEMHMEDTIQDIASYEGYSEADSRYGRIKLLVVPYYLLTQFLVQIKEPEPVPVEVQLRKVYDPQLVNNQAKQEEGVNI